MKYPARLALLLIGLFLMTCSKKESATDHFEARKYFSAYTSGMIDDHAAMTYRLLPSSTIDSVNYLSAFSFKPHVDAKVSYNPSAHEITIQPVKPLVRGQKYRVTIDIDKCLVSSSNQKLNSEIQISHQNLDVTKQHTWPFSGYSPISYHR